MEKKWLRILLSFVVALVMIPMIGSAAFAATYTKAGEVTAVTVTSELLTKPSLGAANPLSPYYEDLEVDSPLGKGAELVMVQWQKKDSTGKFVDYCNATFEAGVYRLEGSLRTLPFDDGTYYALTNQTTLTVNGIAWNNFGKSISDSYATYGFGSNWYYGPEYTVSTSYGKHSIAMQTEGKGTASASVLEAAPGTAVALTAVPASGYIFQNWQVIAGDVTVTNGRFVMGTKDVVLKAVFARVPYTKAGEVTAVKATSPLITEPFIGYDNPLSPYYEDITPDSPKNKEIMLVLVKWQKKDDATGKFEYYNNDKFEPGIYRLEGNLRAFPLEDRTYYALTDTTKLTVNGTAWTNLGNPVHPGTIAEEIVHNWYYSPTYRARYNIADTPAKKITLSAKKFVYNGKARKPSVKIRGLIEGKDFTVSYKHNTKVGQATVVIKGKGNYGGMIEKHFKIVPKRAAIDSLTPGTNKLKVKASIKPSAAGAASYRIAYKRKGASKWETVTTAKQVKTITKLKKGKRYYVKLRAYKVVSGTEYDGAWSKVILSEKIK